MLVLMLMQMRRLRSVSRIAMVPAYRSRRQEPEEADFAPSAREQ